MAEDLYQVPRENALVSLADMATMNVFAQLKVDDPALAEEITQVVHGEIRRIEIEFSIMLLDLKDSFAADVETLRSSGKLPEDHMLFALMNPTSEQDAIEAAQRAQSAGA
jgi:hypothetical protein